MPSDPTLYLYTSLTAGSSHIITGTSRIETILKANKIPFKAVDCATDDTARLIWSRRSKGKKLPGLVKFRDVIADLEQIEEWNEHGELEDEIEAVIDIFGDVPVSGTVADAQAAAAARASAQSQGGGSAQARTASETRHISISDPKDARKPSDTSPMSMAMRQAGAEAAAKAGQRKAGSDPATGPSAITDTVKGTPAVASAAATTSSSSSTSPASLPESQEPSTVTDAKTPDLLASEGAAKTSVDKIHKPTETDEETSSKSTLEQTLDQRRKSSVPNTPSSLAKTTSIDQSHTVTSSEDPSQKSAAASSSKTEKPPTQHRGSNLDPASAAQIKEIEKRNSIAEEEEEEDSSAEESEEDGETGKGKSAGLAKKVGATSAQEAKVEGAQKTQDQKAKDGDQAGVSVGD